MAVPTNYKPSQFVTSGWHDHVADNVPNKRFNPTLCRGRVWGLIITVRAAHAG